MNPEQIIRDACVKANPTDSRWNVVLSDEEKVRLADVLLAMPDWQKEGKLFFSAGYVYHGTSTVNYLLWNLRADDLSLQSDETKQFLADLLTPNP